MRIAIYGSFEAAHRLTATPGDCMNIHGHSFKVRLQLDGPMNSHGMVKDFRDVKPLFRDYLKDEYDHRLLLNEHDRLIESELPGVRPFGGEPTTENIARDIGEWAQRIYPDMVIQVTVRETDFNEAVWP